MAGLIPDGEGLRLQLEAVEVEVLVGLVEGLAERVAAASGMHTQDGAPDPLVAPLIPTVSRGDAEVDAELRSMLRDDLLATRTDRLTRLVADLRAWSSSAGGAVDHLLDRERAMRIVETINDVRLALAAMVGYDEQLRDELEPDDARTDAVRLMDALAWLQGGLIEFVEGEG